MLALLGRKLCIQRMIQDEPLLGAHAAFADSTLWVSSFACTEWPLMCYTSCCRCQDESIDELAAYLRVGEVVAAMTAKCGICHTSHVFPT